MRDKFFIFLPIAFLIAQLAALFWLRGAKTDDLRDPVEINEAVQSVRADWNNIAEHQNRTSLDYTVLDRDGNLLYQTDEGLSESVREAAIRRDTVLDVEIGGETVGTILIRNDISRELADQREKITAVIAFTALAQCAFLAAYLIRLNRTVVKPFRKLERFAERVAGGNLDLPLEMDRQNVFGAFTESFDLMRAELKKARLAEAKANASKKELVAKLSHDIRTPVASVKAVAEVGAARAENEKTRQSYDHIIRKADQIGALVSNLFSATLEELQQLSVEPDDLESTALSEMLKTADYFGRARIPEIPECMLWADRLRLQQVFDNLFANSYKYADTPIDITVGIRENRLFVTIEDRGGGVPESELPFLKEKFRRGSNAERIDGAGLGLYISDRFLHEMGGALTVENGANGLLATVWIALSGGKN